uniref:Uncharacterized protein n=2 Tax=Phytophthora fragariae TaxID=53985 RepID=A0A6A3FD09_9STRA|nr:hypothetical protein PF009_g10305 [Phytophthora fragariae]
MRGNQEYRHRHGRDVTSLPLVHMDNTAGEIIDSMGTLSLTRVPGHLVVIDAGVIGLGLGSVYKCLGSKETAVKFPDAAFPDMNKESIKKFIKLLKKRASGS